jgi:hypothetical protein
MAILGFLVVLATAAVPAGDWVTRFFLTTVNTTPILEAEHSISVSNSSF